MCRNQKICLSLRKENVLWGETKEQIPDLIIYFIFLVEETDLLAKEEAIIAYSNLPHLPFPPALSLKETKQHPELMVSKPFLYK